MPSLLVGNLADGTESGSTDFDLRHQVYEDRRRQLIKWKKHIMSKGAGIAMPFGFVPSASRPGKPAVTRNIATLKSSATAIPGMSILENSTIAPAPNGIIKSCACADVEIQTESVETISCGIQTEIKTTIPTAPKKKPKGMNFDATFLKFNKLFVDTCSLLSQKSKQWTTVMNSEEVNANGIPEEFQGEILSVLGSTHQLLQSKLPQFAELLNFYLLKNQDPVPTMPQDLEGWWEVAMKQIDKTLKVYEKLDAMKDDEWKAPNPDPEMPMKKKLTASAAAAARVLSGNAQSISPSKPQTTATASFGLKAFLAAKRANPESRDRSFDQAKQEEIEIGLVWY